MCTERDLRWFCGMGGGGFVGASADSSEILPQASALLTLLSPLSCPRFFENGFVEDVSGRSPSLELALDTSVEPTRKGSLELEFDRPAGPTRKDSGMVSDVGCSFLFLDRCSPSASWPSLQIYGLSGSESVTEFRSSCRTSFNLKGREVAGAVGETGYGGEEG
jgi:hypothetical protein